MEASVCVAMVVQYTILLLHNYVRCVFTSSVLSAALAESTASSSSVATFRSDNDQVGAGSTYGAEAFKPAIPFPSPFPALFAVSLPAGTLVAVVLSTRCWSWNLCVVDGRIPTVRSAAGVSWAEINATVALSMRRSRQQARAIMANARKSSLAMLASSPTGGHDGRGGYANIATGLSLCDVCNRVACFPAVLCISCPSTADSWTMAPSPEKQAGKLLGLLAEGEFTTLMSYCTEIKLPGTPLHPSIRNIRLRTAPL